MFLKSTSRWVDADTRIWVGAPGATVAPRRRPGTQKEGAGNIHAQRGCVFPTSRVPRPCVPRFSFRVFSFRVLRVAPAPRAIDRRRASPRSDAMSFASERRVEQLCSRGLGLHILEYKCFADEADYERAVGEPGATILQTPGSKRDRVVVQAKEMSRFDRLEREIAELKEALAGKADVSALAGKEDRSRVDRLEGDLRELRDATIDNPEFVKVFSDAGLVVADDREKLETIRTMFNDLPLLHAVYVTQFQDAIINKVAEETAEKLEFDLVFDGDKLKHKCFVKDYYDAVQRKTGKRMRGKRLSFFGIIGERLSCGDKTIKENFKKLFSVRDERHGLVHPKGALSKSTANWLRRTSIDGVAKLIPIATALGVFGAAGGAGGGG